MQSLLPGCLGIASIAANGKPVACRWRARVLIVMVLAAIPAFGGCFQYKVGAVPDPQHPLADRAAFTFAITVIVGVLSPLTAACLLALLCTRQPGPARLLSRLLSSRMLAALADVSYDIYLLHPLVSALSYPIPLRFLHNTSHHAGPGYAPGLASERPGCWVPG